MGLDRLRRAGVPMWVVLVGLVVGLSAGVVLGLSAGELTREPDPITLEVSTVRLDRTTGTLITDTPKPRSTSSYEGYGTWIDVFDYSPLYAKSASPKVAASDLTEMAEFGVGTIFLQAARHDSKSPMGLVDPWYLAEFILAAHRQGVDVVAWYLPKWEDDHSDIDRIRMLQDFEILGNRFDGVAVDIEWTGGDADLDTRNARLVALSDAARAASGTDPLAAIVLPPVLTEVVNTSYWPEFPWQEIADDYDVWMPMSYWSFRSTRSGYGDGYTYNEESVRRLRSNLGDPEAMVHGIGGIGGIDGVNDSPDPEEPLAALAELDRFVDSLVDTGSVGGSVYDWATLEPAARERLARLFGEGQGASLNLAS